MHSDGKYALTEAQIDAFAKTKRPGLFFLFANLPEEDLVLKDRPSRKLKEAAMGQNLEPPLPEPSF